MIDLRSDTVTLPTEEMREAMRRAVLGDDLRDGDPTVRRLEELSAKITGKEAALFVASGTMANLVALLAHANRGGEVLLDEVRTSCAANSAASPSLPGFFRWFIQPTEARRSGRRARAHPSRDDAESHRHCAYLCGNDT